MSKPAHLHSEKFDLIPIINGSNCTSQKGRNAGNLFAERFQPSPFDLFKRALTNDGAALVIIAPINRDQHPTVADPSQRRFGVGGCLRDPKPQYVNRHAEIFDLHPGPLAQDRTPPISADD